MRRRALSCPGRTPTTILSGYMKSLDRATLFQELRIRYHLDVVLCVGHQLLNVGVGADGNRALHDDDEVVGSVFGQLLCNRKDTALRSASPSCVGGVPTAMKARSTSRTAAARSVVKVRRPALRVLLDHLLEPRLVDRNLVPLEPLDLRHVFVDADHALTGRGKARASHEANVSCANHAKFHRPAIARFPLSERCHGSR